MRKKVLLEKNWFRPIYRQIKRIDGWLSENEARFLYESASNMSSASGVIVEIGSYKGRSAVTLAKGSLTKGEDIIYCIDPWVPFRLKDGSMRDLNLETFYNNIKEHGVSHIICPVREYSHKVVVNWLMPIKILFIDGNHDYEEVKRDFELWVPHVISGGIVALHDTHGFDGPRKLVEEKIPKEKRICVDEITAFVKE